MSTLTWLRLSWVDRVSKTKVLRRSSTQRELLTTRKQEDWISRPCFERWKILSPQLILKGRIEDHWEIGIKQLSWLRNIRAWTGTWSEEELFRTADRKVFARVIHNIRALMKTRCLGECILGNFDTRFTFRVQMISHYSGFTSIILIWFNNTYFVDTGCSEFDIWNSLFPFGKWRLTMLVNGLDGNSNHFLQNVNSN